MERQALKSTLAELHQELAGNTLVDPEVASLLRQIADDIDGLLSTSPSAVPPSGMTAEEHKQGLIDRVLGVTTEFEESHPILAATLGRIADSLSRIGI